MKIKYNQCGVMHLIIPILVLVIAAVGYTGWQVWNRNKKDTAKQSTASSAVTQDTKPTFTTNQEPTTDSDAAQLAIKEWAVKIQLRDADKVTYTYDASQKGRQGEGDGIIDSTIELEVEPRYYHNKDCNPAVGYTRYSKLTDDFFVERATKIGDYYYLSSGSPFNCENDSDNALNGRIREDFGAIEAR